MSAMNPIQRKDRMKKLREKLSDLYKANQNLSGEIKQVVDELHRLEKETEGGTHPSYNWGSKSE